MLITQSYHKLWKGKYVSQIGEELEEGLPVFQNIVIAVANLDPDYDMDAIYKSMVIEK